MPQPVIVRTNQPSSTLQILPSQPLLTSHPLNDYIHAYLDRDLSVGELVAIAQMSRYHFGRLFKQSTGLSPHQYVLQRRIEKAKQLLQELELPIAEVYQQVGFQSQSHFTKVFS